MAVILVTILIGIDQIGIDITLLESVLIIAIGALLFGAALAFGIGARTSVSNILASFYLQRIYKVGDRIRIGDQEGRITEITPLAVLLDCPEGQVCVPADGFSQKTSVLLTKENQ
jgi:small-conductance mechanosensitive channel